MSPADEVHRFEVHVAWKGDAAGDGRVEAGKNGVSIPIAGATSLGGSGTGTNPEELLLSALGACFVNTWAIFLKKLAIAHPEPALRVSGELESDPAGGFRMRKAVIHASVPSALLSAGRGPIEKSLQLTEKYCIVSKVARAAMPLAVEIEEV